MAANKVFGKELKVNKIIDIIKKFDIKLHRLYFLTKAEWYGDDDDISDNFEDWATDYLSNLEKQYKDIGISYIGYIEYVIDTTINHYYGLLGSKAQKKAQIVEKSNKSKVSK